MDPYQKRIVNKKIKILEHAQKQETFPGLVDTLEYRGKHFTNGKELMKKLEKMLL